MKKICRNCDYWAGDKNTPKNIGERCSRIDYDCLMTPGDFSCFAFKGDKMWKDFEEEVEFDLGIGPERIVVAGEYYPGRPAPYSRDPDSPAFSDPGDSAEIDIQTINGKPPKLSSSLLSDLEDILLERLL